jgi:CRP-like cAMP-binding protein
MFEGTEPGALDALASQAVVRHFPKGTIVVHEGEAAETCYVLAEGTAKVYVTGPDGHDLILATLRPPDSFGVVALLDGGVRSASVEVLDALTVAAIARSTFMGLMQGQPAVADSIARATGALVRRLTGQAADLVFLDLEGRVAKLLVSMAGRTVEDGAQPMVLDLGVTQRDLAEMVGGSRQSVNQILHALAGRAFLEMDGQEVTIRDLASLRRRAGM